MKLQTALSRSLRAAELSSADQATSELARIYARRIDDEPDKLYLYGKLFLDTVTALGMTPKARAALIKDAPKAVDSGLDELRARREQRVS